MARKTFTNLSNVKASLNGEILTLEIDLRREIRLSISGKTLIVSTTSGNVSIPDHPGYRLGLTVYKEKPPGMKLSAERKKEYQKAARRRKHYPKPRYLKPLYKRRGRPSKSESEK